MKQNENLTMPSIEEARVVELTDAQFLLHQQLVTTRILERQLEERQRDLLRKLEEAMGAAQFATYRGKFCLIKSQIGGGKHLDIGALKLAYPDIYAKFLVQSGAPRNWLKVVETLDGDDEEEGEEDGQG